MIRIRLSRRALWRASLTIGVAVFLAICYTLGDRLTPYDDTGRPLILSPSIRAAESCRRAVLQWVAEMEEIDRRLTTLLSQEEIGDAAQLYDLSRETQRLSEQAVALARDAAFTTYPPALAGFGEQAQAAAEGYLKAALATARWVGVPQQEGRRAALESLRLARGLRTQLETSRWLLGFDAPDHDNGR